MLSGMGKPNIQKSAPGSFYYSCQDCGEACIAEQDIARHVCPGKPVSLAKRIDDLEARVRALEAKKP